MYLQKDAMDESLINNDAIGENLMTQSSTLTCNKKKINIWSVQIAINIKSNYNIKYII